MLVGGRDVFLIQPAGSGKYLIFSLENTWRNCRVQRHTTLYCIIPHKIFLQRAKKRFGVFLELLKALQRAKTAIAANIAFHIYTGKRNIQYTANVNGLYAIHLIKIFANKQIDLTAARVCMKCKKKKCKNKNPFKLR